MTHKLGVNARMGVIYSWMHPVASRVNRTIHLANNWAPGSWKPAEDPRDWVERNHGRTAYVLIATDTTYQEQQRMNIEFAEVVEKDFGQTEHTVRAHLELWDEAHAFALQFDGLSTLHSEDRFILLREYREGAGRDRHVLIVIEELPDLDGTRFETAGELEVWLDEHSNGEFTIESGDNAVQFLGELGYEVNADNEDALEIKAIVP